MNFGAIVNRIYLAVVFLSAAAMVSIVIAGVVFRYVLQSPLVYSFDLSTLLFAWMIFLGLVVADQHRAHLGVDVFVSGLSPRWQLVFETISDLVVLAIALMLCWLGLELTLRTGLQITSMRISLKWLYASLPVGMGLFSLWMVVKLTARLAFGRDLRTPSTPGSN